MTEILKESPSMKIDRGEIPWEVHKGIIQIQNELYLSSGKKMKRIDIMSMIMEKGINQWKKETGL